MTPATAKCLKWLRVAAQALMLTMLTLFYVGFPVALIAITQLSNKLQMIPMLTAMGISGFVFWVVITLLFGRIYCSIICPMGALMDIVARLRRGRIYRYSPSRLHISIFMLAVTAAAAILGFHTALLLLDPTSEYSCLVQHLMHPATLASIIGILNIIIVALALYMAWTRGRLFCNTLCPIGGALSIVSRASLYHIEIDPDKCIRCRRCVDVCKAECIEIDTCVVDNARCVTCFNCLPVCPNEAIDYTIERKKLSTPMFRRVLPKVNTSMNNETVLRSTRPHPQKRR